MPLTTIEIEQVGADRWIARLETGSLTARRSQYQASTLGDVMAAAEAGYWELSGAPRPEPAAPPHLQPRPSRDRLPPLREGVSR